LKEALFDLISTLNLGTGVRIQTFSKASYNKIACRFYIVKLEAYAAGMIPKKF
jgi:hypothetical protein